MRSADGEGSGGCALALPSLGSPEFFKFYMQICILWCFFGVSVALKFGRGENILLPQYFILFFWYLIYLAAAANRFNSQ